MNASAEAPVLPSSQNSPQLRSVEVSSQEPRYAALDIARGLAVMGMIYLHFVPAEGANTAFEQSCTGLTCLPEGKPAALFCVLAGMSWAIQAERATNRRLFFRYVIRRAATLAAVGVLIHYLVWPTEVLLPLSLMMLLSHACWRAGRRVTMLVLVLLVAATPMIPLLLANYVALDWNADGSHAADGAPGPLWAWATMRLLLFDGSYPILPWLAFPLLGMSMVRGDWTAARRAKKRFWVACALAVAAHVYVAWIQANAEVLGDWAAYLDSTWVPTSIPFLLVGKKAPQKNV